MYTKSKDAFLWLSTSFGKSVCYEVLSFACLTVNKARYLQGRVGTSPSGSLTTAKFNGLSVHCFVALFQLLYVYYFRISCPYNIASGQSTQMLQFYGNIAETSTHVQVVDSRPSPPMRPGDEARYKANSTLLQVA